MRITVKEKIIATFRGTDELEKARFILRASTGGIRFNGVPVIFTYQNLFEFIKRHVPELTKDQYEQACQDAELIS